MRRALLLLFPLMLAGCAGKPTTYLALKPSKPVQPRHTASLPALAVGSVDMPPAIDRRQLTTSTAAGTLHVSGKTEWAGALGPMARIVLAQDLAARLPDETVLMPGDPLPPGGAAAVHVVVQDFMPDDAGRVTLNADWSVAVPQGRDILARGRFARTVPGGSDAAGEARSMSRAMGELASAIARGLASRAE